MKWEKTGQNCEEKVKLERKSFRKSRKYEYNLLNMEEVWKILHKITGINNPKEKMKWNKSFIIAMPPKQNDIFYY